MFPVVLNDGQSKMPDADVYYVIAKEGVFLKKRLGIMESLAPVTEISILESIKATATMHIEKIPGPQCAKVIEFFKAVYKEYYGEAIVLLFYDETNKKYLIIPPHQKVSGGSCDYNRGITVEGYTMIGTIHSHAPMSAFHSSTDDKDEETFDGLHITFGNMRDADISISASIVANGYRMMVDPCDYIDKLKLTKDVDEDAKGATTTVYEWKAGKLQKNEKKTSRYGYSYRRYDKRYVVEVTDHQRHFNQKWMKVVEKGTYTYRGGRTAGFLAGGYGGYGYGGWGHEYDPTAWRQSGFKYPGTGGNAKPPGSIVVHGKPDPRNVGPYKTQGVVFPEHDQDDDINPCHNCVNRDFKLDWALEQFTEEAEDEPDEKDVIDNFASRDDYDKMFMDGNIACHNCFETYHSPSYEACPTCGAPNIDSVQVQSSDPLYGKDFHCPTCGNDSTYDGADECPFCKTELDFTDLRKEAAAVNDAFTKMTRKSDEETEVSGVGNLEPNLWYMCHKCTTVFQAEDDEADCPVCHESMIDGYNCTPYNVEDEKTSIAAKDSGKLITDSKSDILQQAAEADKQLERIPDPEKSETPLSTHVQKTSRMSIKEMFKKTFGKEK